MKNHRSKNLHLAGFELTAPTVLCIDGRRSRGGRMTLLMGYVTAYADTIVASLAGEWLSRHLHRRFVEHGRDAEGDLAAQAFYDKLANLFGRDVPFLAAVMSPPLGTSAIPGVALEGGTGKTHLAEHRIDGDVLCRFVRGGGLVRWNCSGRVRAHHNLRTGIAQVTFDPLPGGIELAGTDKLAQSGARALKQTQVVSAWYGFGVPIRDPTEFVVTLRNAIGELRHAPAQRAAHA